MLKNSLAVEKDLPLKEEDLIVLIGLGGYLAGNLVLCFVEKGFTNIRALAGRNSDNPFIKCVTGWESKALLDRGLVCAYHRISQQYQKRKVCLRIGVG